jgi:phage FluMu protein Com
MAKINGFHPGLVDLSKNEGVKYAALNVILNENNAMLKDIPEKTSQDESFKPIKCECGAVLMKSMIPNPPVEIKCRKCKRVVKLYEKASLGITIKI